MQLNFPIRQLWFPPNDKKHYRYLSGNPRLDNALALEYQYAKSRDAGSRSLNCRLEGKRTACKGDEEMKILRKPALSAALLLLVSFVLTANTTASSCPPSGTTGIASSDTACGGDNSSTSGADVSGASDANPATTSIFLGTSPVVPAPFNTSTERNPATTANAASSGTASVSDTRTDAKHLNIPALSQVGAVNNTVATTTATLSTTATDNSQLSAHSGTDSATATLSSQMSRSPKFSHTASFTVSWKGRDSTGSGIAYYKIYVSTDHGPFQLWLTTTQTSAVFTGALGHVYSFYSVAVNHNGDTQTIIGSVDTTLSPGHISREISYFGTQTPGDAWSWTINKDATGGGSFAGVNHTSGKIYSGTVLTLSNRFLQLTVTATTDTNLVVGSSSATMYAIEFPNTALIVKPAGYNDAPVIAAAQGVCPAAASYNWVKMPNLTWNVGSDPAYGTAVTSGTADNFGFSIQPYLLGGASLSPIAQSGYSCYNGLITSTAANTAQFGVTPSGVFIADQGTEGGIIGMLQPSAKIGSSAVLQAGREFRGFVFMTHAPFENGDCTVPGDRTQAIWSRTLGNNLITAAEYTDFVNGTEDSCPGGDSCATLSLDNELAPGEFSGTMTDSHAGAHPFTLMINQINGKYMVFGFSQEQAGGPGCPYNGLFPYLLAVMEQ